MRRIKQRAPFRSALVALALAATPAFAINEMFAKDAPIARMTAEDLRIWSDAIRDALDRRHDGDAFTWSNPATKAAGTIRVVASFERSGMTCRGAEFTNTAGGETSRTAWNLCKTPQGWKFAEGR